MAAWNLLVKILMVTLGELLSTCVTTRNSYALSFFPHQPRTCIHKINNIAQLHAYNEPTVNDFTAKMTPQYFPKVPSLHRMRLTCSISRAFCDKLTVTLEKTIPVAVKNMRG